MYHWIRVHLACESAPSKLRHFEWLACGDANGIAKWQIFVTIPRLWKVCLCANTSQTAESREQREATNSSRVESSERAKQKLWPRNEPKCANNNENKNNNWFLSDDFLAKVSLAPANIRSSEGLALNANCNCKCDCECDSNCDSNCDCDSNSPFRHFQLGTREFGSAKIAAKCSLACLRGPQIRPHSRGERKCRLSVGASSI